jgi:glutamyl-tRNA synthetase
LAADSPEGRKTLQAVAPLISERLKRLDEAPPMIAFLFGPVTLDEKASKVIQGQAEYLRAVADRLEGTEGWTAVEIEESLRGLAAERELNPKQAVQPIRAAVTGTLVSPPLFESLEILGRQVAVERLRAAPQTIAVL